MLVDEAAVQLQIAGQQLQVMFLPVFHARAKPVSLEGRHRTWTKPCYMSQFQFSVSRCYKTR